MVIFGALTVLVATLGYKYIHLLGRISTVIGVLGFTYLGIRLFASQDVGALLASGTFEFPTFLLAISLGAGWQLTYGPYVADYSRYLPSKTPARKTFLAAFLGTVMGSQWSMTLGALFASLALPKGQRFLDGQVAFLGNLSGGGLIAVVIYLVIVTGKLTVNTLNAYGGYMTMLTSVTAFTRKTAAASRTRFAYVIGFIGLSVLDRHAGFPRLPRQLQELRPAAAHGLHSLERHQPGGLLPDLQGEGGHPGPVRPQRPLRTVEQDGADLLRDRHCCPDPVPGADALHRPR